MFLSRLPLVTLGLPGLLRCIVTSFGLADSRGTSLNDE